VYPVLCLKNASNNVNVIMWFMGRDFVVHTSHALVRDLVHVMSGLWCYSIHGSVGGEGGVGVEHVFYARCDVCV